jgi:hypothetical protein
VKRLLNISKYLTAEEDIRREIYSNEFESISRN